MSNIIEHLQGIAKSCLLDSALKRCKICETFKKPNFCAAVPAAITQLTSVTIAPSMLGAFLLVVHIRWLPTLPISVDLTDFSILMRILLLLNINILFSLLSNNKANRANRLLSLMNF
jgi:hypothetical protein